MQKNQTGTLCHNICKNKLKMDQRLETIKLLGKIKQGNMLFDVGLSNIFSFSGKGNQSKNKQLRSR